MAGAKAAPALKEATDANLTGDGTHVAVARGFCEEIIEVGQIVPAGHPVGSWMEPVSKKASASED